MRFPFRDVHVMYMHFLAKSEVHKKGIKNLPLRGNSAIMYITSSIGIFREGAHMSLAFSTEKIVLSLQKGEVYRGSFSIYAGADMITSGTVKSSDLRMECLNADFNGSESEIFFAFHGECLDPDMRVEGFFAIASNWGEYVLPFEVAMQQESYLSSMGEITNLDQFANLAKNSWQEAVKCFYSESFKTLLTGDAAQYAESYRALSAIYGKEQNMDEFLILTGRKQPVEFWVQDTLEIELPKVREGEVRVTEVALPITKKGWGYTKLQVQCEGSSFGVEKEVLTDDDFLGEKCVLPILAGGAGVRAGKNFGKITLRYGHRSLQVTVLVRTKSAGEKIAVEHEKKQDMLRLMKLYCDFRCKKLSTSMWLRETEQLIEKRVAIQPDDMTARLFQAQLLITKERYGEANWVLDHVLEQMEKNGADESLQAYYLYLTTLIHNDDAYSKEVTQRVEELYRKDRTNWRIAWLLFYLSTDFLKTMAAKLAFLEKQFEMGAASPILYIEALTLLNQNPATLRRLGAFERQVLWYGAKQDKLKPEIIEQILYLSGKIREYSPLITRILMRIYQKEKDVRILQEVCSMLMKGGKIGKKYLAWYRAGVKAQLRLTSLYESYVLSLDLEQEEEIPKSVLLYFSYQNNPDYKRSAYLYRYVLNNKDRLGDLYATYRGRLESFCIEQMEKLRLDRSLVPLYEEILKEDLKRDRLALCLSRLLFAKEIRIEGDAIRKAYVYHVGATTPEEYTVSDGTFWAAFYEENALLVLEDAEGNRYIKSVPYEKQPLLDTNRFLHLVERQDTVAPMFDFYLCTTRKSHAEEPASRGKRMRRVLETGLCDRRLAGELTCRLLEYYSESGTQEEYSAYLRRIKPESLTAKVRAKVLDHIVQDGQFGAANAWIHEMGPYFANDDALRQILEALPQVEDDVMTFAAMHLFRRGIKDRVVLTRLVKSYRGLCQEMQEIWLAAQRFDLDDYALSEAILQQVVFCGVSLDESMSIFRKYSAKGVDLYVATNFLTQCAFDYFASGYETDADVYAGIAFLYEHNVPLHRVCKLAYLKYYAEHRGEETKESRKLADHFLDEFMEEGLHLECFKAYREHPMVREDLSDKTILEYRTVMGATPRIRFAIEDADKNISEYVVSSMREVCEGVYCKECILFFGESLVYEIMDEADGVSAVTESGRISGRAKGYPGESDRYTVLNEMIRCKNMGDADRMEYLLSEYKKREFLNDKLFFLK